VYKANLKSAANSDSVTVAIKDVTVAIKEIHQSVDTAKVESLKKLYEFQHEMLVMR
jgi:hypothetical protein